jgi:hypothetical protein
MSSVGAQSDTPELKTTSFGAQSNPCDFLVDLFKDAEMIVVGCCGLADETATIWRSSAIPYMNKIARVLPEFAVTA